MAHKKSEFLGSFGKAFQVFKALTDEVLNLGGGDEDLRKLETDGDLRRKIADLIVGETAPVFSRDMTKEGWTLLERGPKRVINSVADLELVPILKSDESLIKGEEVVRRARNELNANRGQEDAEWLFQHQDQIPAEFRKFFPTFPGTVWRGSDGRCVSCLYWDGDRWGLDFRWLRSVWSDDYRLLRCK